MTTVTKQAHTFRLGEQDLNRLGYGGMQLTGPGVFGDAPDRARAKKFYKRPWPPV
jgi:pyridoxine 4-dehydrogenase